MVFYEELANTMPPRGLSLEVPILFFNTCNLPYIMKLWEENTLFKVMRIYLWYRCLVIF